ncbi:MAG: serine/threonine-protein kinase, partial [Myxococcota bacterium]
MNQRVHSLDQYTILEKVGDGGMAEVFLASFPVASGFSQKVAIKKLHPHIARNPNNVKMFIHEARLIGTLKHPNLVRIFDFGQTHDSYYLVMEYVNGLSLTRLLRQSQQAGILLPVPIGVFIVCEVLEALFYVHNAKSEQGTPLNLVHRDLSPDNILIDNEGGVKLTDFGIAKSSIQEHYTQTGMTKGKILYMSPEQCYGRQLDHLSDIFAMGNLLFETTTLRRLFAGKDMASIAMAICHEPLPHPSSVRRHYPPELKQILFKALMRRKEERFQSAKEMADGLKQ